MLHAKKLISAFAVDDMSANNTKEKVDFLKIAMLNRLRLFDMLS